MATGGASSSDEEYINNRRGQRKVVPGYGGNERPNGEPGRYVEDDEKWYGGDTCRWGRIPRSGWQEDLVSLSCLCHFLQQLPPEASSHTITIARGGLRQVYGYSMRQGTLFDVSSSVYTILS